MVGLFVTTFATNFVSCSSVKENVCCVLGCGRVMQFKETNDLMYSETGST